LRIFYLHRIAGPKNPPPPGATAPRKNRPNPRAARRGAEIAGHIAEKRPRGLNLRRSNFLSGRIQEIFHNHKEWGGRPG
jgi:hypothetical protein